MRSTMLTGIIGALLALVLFTACTPAGSGGGDDNRNRSDSVTGPSPVISITCNQSADRNVGDTTTNVTVDCTKDSGNTTAKAPGGTTE